MTAITPLPPLDRASATFKSDVDTFFAIQLPTFSVEANAAAVAMNLNSTNDTSATSNAIGTGAKTFTVSIGKSFLGGMYLIIADTAAPSTNSMAGQVTSYNSGTGELVMSITSTKGSGTKTAWTISQSSVGMNNNPRNFITNGGFTEATRGSAFINCLNSYTLVGWFAYGGPGNIIVTRVAQPSSVSHSGYSLRFNRAPGDTSTNYIGIIHTIKSLNSYPLAGKTVTLAFIAQSLSNFSALGGLLYAEIAYGTGTDERGTVFTGRTVITLTSFAITPSPQIYYDTVNIPSNATEISVAFGYYPVGTAGAVDSFDLADVQLRIENSFTELNITNDMENKLACMELCESSFSPNVSPAQNVGLNSGESRLYAQYAGATANYFYVPFKVKKRNSSFAITLYNPAAANANIRDIAGSVDFTTSSPTANGTNGFNISATGNAATDVFNRCGVHWLVENEL